MNYCTLFLVAEFHSAIRKMLNDFFGKNLNTLLRYFLYQ